MNRVVCFLSRQTSSWYGIHDVCAQVDDQHDLVTSAHGADVQSAVADVLEKMLIISKIEIKVDFSE